MLIKIDGDTLETIISDSLGCCFHKQVTTLKNNGNVILRVNDRKAPIYKKIKAAIESNFNQTPEDTKDKIHKYSLYLYDGVTLEWFVTVKEKSRLDIIFKEI